MTTQNWRFCLAPMMDWSDRHCRFFWRLMTKQARLYTEMVTTGALLHGDRERFLRFAPEEHPLALQLGGSDPQALADCARFAEDWGYDEVNLNCGCPSDRVQNNKIGACLMAEPDTVAECIAAMRAAVTIPVTVKHRIGIDELDSPEHLHQFVSVVAQAGCEVFIIHARKAWLKGLSPKENREIPPLHYERVAEVKRQFPDKTIVINGGVTTLEQCQALLAEVDGVMIGREAYHNPFVLTQVDPVLFGEADLGVSRDEILEEYAHYCRQQLHAGTRLNHVTRHILGLYAGQPGGRRFRRYISEQGTQAGAGADILTCARQAMDT